MVPDKIVLCDTDVIIEFYKNNVHVISKLKAIGQEIFLLALSLLGNSFMVLSIKRS